MSNEQTIIELEHIETKSRSTVEPIFSVISYHTIFLTKVFGQNIITRTQMLALESLGCEFKIKKSKGSRKINE